MRKPSAVHEDIERRLEYAGALTDFFDTLILSRDARPVDLSFELNREFYLSPEDRLAFHETAIRASRAKGIIRHLESMFGIDDERRILDPQGLHRSLFRGRYVPKYMDARSYNIALGFRKHIWRKKDTLGYTQDTKKDVLIDPLSLTLQNLERGKPTTCRRLAFFTRGHLYQGDRLIKAASPALDEETDDTITVYHELRHVIDNIIGPALAPAHNGLGCWHIETPAYLAHRSLEGVGHDREDLEDYLESALYRKKAAARVADELIRNRDMIPLLEGKKKGVTAHFLRLYQALSAIPETDMKKVSYVVSTTEAGELSEVLRQIAAYLKPLDEDQDNYPAP